MLLNPDDGLCFPQVGLSLSPKVLVAPHENTLRIIAKFNWNDGLKTPPSVAT